MKHILNNISREEKRRILEQHSGGVHINTTRFRTLLESTLGNVKPLISEDDTDPTKTTGGGGGTTTTKTTGAGGTPPKVSSGPQNTTGVGNSGTEPQKNIDTSTWIKAGVFSDPEAKQRFTNIEINPKSIRLVGSNVDFSYMVAGKGVVGLGHFYCDGRNELVFEDKPLTGSFYISSERIGYLQSQCGENQGYASTNKGTDQNVA